jgi:hypothetical protein
VNIHNPHDSTITFVKKLALTHPRGGQEMGAILPIGTDTLMADGALQTDCEDLLEKLFSGEFPASHIEGFVIIESQVSLDVNTIYTAAKPGDSSSAPTVTGIDVEQIKEREIDRATQARPD